MASAIYTRAVGTAVTTLPRRLELAPARFRQIAWWTVGWLVLIVALLAGGYQWFVERRDAEALRADVAQRLTTIDASAAQARARESDIANELRDAQALFVAALHWNDCGERQEYCGAQPRAMHWPNMQKRTRRAGAPPSEAFNSAS